MAVRDKDGFLSAQGSWAHCMAVVAYRCPSSGREGFLVWNSWRADAHDRDAWVGGPVWPDQTMPHGSFWISVKDMDRIVRQKGSYVLGNYDGFEKRELTISEAFGTAGGKVGPKKPRYEVQQIPHFSLSP